MHPCLLVEELAAHIAEACVLDVRSLSDGNSIKWDRRTAYALARTCHALLEPALDAIWHYQYGLDHLLACVPDDLWQRSWEEPQPSTYCVMAALYVQLVLSFHFKIPRCPHLYLYSDCDAISS